MQRISYRLGVRFASLTADAYNVTRKPFGKLGSSDLDFFRSTGAGVTTDKTDLEPFNQDWMKKYFGQSKVMVAPRSLEQVSQVVKHCYENNLAVVPQGGNTGLVGGGIPVFDEVILSLANMRKIRSFDPLSGVLVADAGVVLQDADEYVRKQNHIFPLDLGAKGSCHIGGNVATNAGGLRLLRYGSLHGTVLGVEAVLPNGEIFDGLSTLRKDNTGYDLKQLFIGSEGTLGIITGISILCPAAPSSVHVAFLGLDSFEQVQETFKMSRSHLGEVLSSFECMDEASLRLVRKNTSMQPPLEGIHPFYVLVETSGSDATHDEEKLERFLEELIEKSVIEDGVLAQDQTQIANLWAWRELIPEESTKYGGVYKYDVSLPLGAMWELVDATRDRLKGLGLLGDSPEFEAVDSIGYGHIGDGNLHLNIPVRAYSKKMQDALEPWVFEFVQKYNGSVSAEHGLGFQKAHAVGYSKSKHMISLMKGIKDHWDPKGIMNPYKYLQ